MTLIPRGPSGTMQMSSAHKPYHDSQTSRTPYKRCETCGKFNHIRANCEYFGNLMCNKTSSFRRFSQIAILVAACLRYSCADFGTESIYLVILPRFWYPPFEVSFLDSWLFQKFKLLLLEIRQTVDDLILIAKLIVCCPMPVSCWNRTVKNRLSKILNYWTISIKRVL